MTRPPWWRPFARRRWDRAQVIAIGQLVNALHLLQAWERIQSAYFAQMQTDRTAETDKVVN
jgi:hypothetical protein